MRFLRPVVFLFALVALAPVALADEIIHFTNGTALPVLSHTIEDGMIKVDLGDDAVMAFPEYLVERIEGSDKDLAGLGYNSNLRQGGSAGKGRNGANQAIPDLNAIQDFQIMQLPENVKVDARTGLATHRPFSGSAASNKRKMQITANTRAMSARMAPGRGGYKGARRMGGKQVIDRSPIGRRDGSPTKTKMIPTLAHPGGSPPLPQRPEPLAEGAEGSGSSED